MRVWPLGRCMWASTLRTALLLHIPVLHRSYNAPFLHKGSRLKCCVCLGGGVMLLVVGCMMACILQLV